MNVAQAGYSPALKPNANKGHDALKHYAARKGLKRRPSPCRPGVLSAVPDRGRLGGHHYRPALPGLPVI